MLKLGGKLIFMVYAAYLYRLWRVSTMRRVKYRWRELTAYHGVVGESREKYRAAFDASSNGGGASHTD